MSNGNNKESDTNNVVSTYYVITMADQGIVVVEPTIYLSYPTSVGPYETVYSFENVFAAKNFVRFHVLPEEPLRIAG